MKIRVLCTSLFVVVALVIGQLSFGMERELVPMPVCQAQTIKQINLGKILVKGAEFNPANKDEIFLTLSDGCKVYNLENGNISSKELSDNKESISHNSPSQAAPYTMHYNNKQEVIIVHTKTNTPLYAIKHDADINFATFNADQTKLITVSTKNNSIKVSSIEKPIMLMCNTDFIVVSPHLVCTSKTIKAALRDNTNTEFIPLMVNADDFKKLSFFMMLQNKDDVTTSLKKLDFRSLCSLLKASDYLDIVSNGTSLTNYICEIIANKYNSNTDLSCIEELPFELENMIAQNLVKDVCSYVDSNSTPFNKESDVVLSVTVSPNGKHFAAGLWNTTVTVYDSKTKACLHILKGHKARVLSAVFSPTQDIIATGSVDRTVKIWDIPTGTVKNTFEHAAAVSSVIFSLDGNLLATGSWDNTAKIWDLKEGKCITTLTGHTGKIRSIAFSRDGKHIVSGSEDKTVRVWNTTTGLTIHTVSHGNCVSSVAFNPDNNSFASASHDGTAKLWDSQTGKEKLCFRGHEGLVFCVAFNHNGKLLATGAEDTTIKIWTTDTGQCLTTLKGHTDSINSLAFTPDGQNLLTGGQDHTIKIWAIDCAAKQKLLNELEGKQAGFLLNKLYPVIQKNKMFDLVKGSADYELWMTLSPEAQKYLERYIRIV